MIFHYCTVILNIRLSIFFGLCFGDIYFSLGISLSFSFLSVSEVFCHKFFETFVILLAILLPIKSPVAYAVFEIPLFEEVSSTFVANVLA